VLANSISVNENNSGAGELTNKYFEMSTKSRGDYDLYK